MRHPLKLGSLALALLGSAAAAYPGCGWAQEAASPEPASSHEGRHFSHPLVGETPFRDTDLRLDYVVREGAGSSGGTSAIRLEARYALDDRLSVELSLPHHLEGAEATGSHGDAPEIAFALASPVLERGDLSVAYGLEVGFPLGGPETDAGSNPDFELEPFAGLGWRWRSLEAIGHAAFAAPVGADGTTGALEYNVSLLYALSPGVAGLLELTRTGEGHEAATHVTPGVRLRPTGEDGPALGLGASLPLSTHEESEMHGTVSVFLGL